MPISPLTFKRPVIKADTPSSDPSAMAMAEGSLDGVSAFMTGRLKVSGDMGIAMKLGALLV